MVKKAARSKARKGAGSRATERSARTKKAAPRKATPKLRKAELRKLWGKDYDAIADFVTEQRAQNVDPDTIVKRLEEKIPNFPTCIIQIFLPA